MAPGERHRYLLELEEPSFVNLFLEQDGVDLIAQLLDPEGRVVAETSGPRSRHGRRLVVAVTDQPGRYLLKIASREPGDAGSYVLGLLAQRPIRPGDQQRVLALRRFAEGKLYNHRHAPPESRRRALASFQDAARLFESAGDADGQAWALALAADVLLNLEEWEEAREQSRRAYEIFNRSESISQDGNCTAMTALARALGRLREVQEAFAFFERALDECPDRRGQGFNLLNRGDLFLQIQQPAKAKHDFERAEEIWSHAPNEDRPWLITALINLGLAEHELGELEEAFESYRQAESLIKEVGTVQDEIHLYSNLGRYYLAVGELQKSLDNLQRGLRLAREREDGLAEQAITRSLALLNQILGRNGEAERLYRRSIEVSRNLDDTVGVAKGLLALAQIAWELDRRAEALHLLDDALGNAQRSYNLAVEADILRQTGVYLVMRGDPAGGLVGIREARRLGEAVAPPSLRSAMRRAEAQALQALGRITQAHDVLAPALQLDLALDNPLERVEVDVALAELERRLKRLDAAQRHLEEAVALQETVRATVTDPELRAGFLSRRHKIYEELIDLLMDRAERQPQTGFATRAMEVSEQARGRTLAEILADPQIQIERGISDEIRQQERSLSIRLALLQSEAWAAASEGEPLQATLKRALARVRDEIDQFSDTVQRDWADYAALRYPSPLDLHSIQSALPKHISILHYALGESRSFAFLIQANGLFHWQLPGAAELGQGVATLNKTIVGNDPRSLQVLREARRSLYQLLVAPAAGRLATTDHLWIVPDGALFYLPFEALVGNDLIVGKDEPLVSRWSVSYAPSVTVMARLAEATPRFSPSDFVAFAGPAIPSPTGATSTLEAAPRGTPETVGLHPLPGTVEEVDMISRLFPDRSSLYIGDEANQDNVFGNPYVEKAQWLHFATHGIIRESEPTRSALLLSPAANGDDQLEVGEIFNLRLSADVVVLSACDTGLGELVRGEGLIGLSRAFFYAGAANVLVSLQNVSDQGTPLLMKLFYCGLANGLEPAAALQQAKTEMIRDQTYRNPRYWAPFVLFGAASNQSAVTLHSSCRLRD